MKDIEYVVLASETPEADAIEQHRVIDPDDEIRLDTAWIDAHGDRYASEADVVDQAIIVPIPEDDVAGV